MPPSLCTWVAHQVSCLMNATRCPIQTRFRFGSDCDCLSLATPINSLAHSPKGTPSGIRPKSPSPPTVCQRTVSGSVSLPSPGFFSPFPHGTSSLSVASEYLALEDGPPGFPRDYTCPAVLGNCFQRDQTHFDYGTITLYGGSFQKPSSMSWFDNSPGCTLKQPRNPGLIAKSGLGSSLFARRY